MGKGTKAVIAMVGVVISVAFLLGFASRVKPGLFMRPSIGLLRVDGVIYDTEWYIDQVRMFRDDNRIKGVVLRINSPGGVIAPTQELFEELIKLKEDKPLVASMGTVAASGGYYLCCAADWVISNPGTITGSIGVIMEFTNVEDLFQKLGLKSRVIKSGKHKDMGSPFRELTPEEEMLLGGLVQDAHEQFVEAVLEGRPVERDEILPYLDGRVFTGRQAMKMGLVDEMGNLNDALEKTAEMAGLPDVPPRVVEPKQKRRGLFSILFGITPERFLEIMASQSANGVTSDRALQLWRAF